MGQESNLEPIRALERQIEEGKGDVIEFKRARNSLLNISVRVPPEILGCIFAWCVAWGQDYSITYVTALAGPKKGSYNFLLVCRHWFEVASNTPELWTFWGDTLQTWEKRCRGAGTTPVDLVLNPHCQGALSSHLQGALQERATRDEIRRIHFLGDDPNLLTSILRPLTPDGEDVREKRIESIVLQSLNLPKLSTFFAQLHLSGLQHLLVSGAPQDAPWDRLGLLTTSLTTLQLRFTGTAHLPITPHIISILTSNPNLRRLVLASGALPGDVDQPGIRVPLRHLRTIELDGEFRRVFGLLQRLEFPATLDHMELRLDDSTPEEVSRILGPYMQDHLQRNTRFRDRLAVTSSGDCIGVRVCQIGDRFEHLAPWARPSASFTASITGTPRTVGRTLPPSLVGLIPHDRVVSLRMDHSTKIPEELFAAMPNIETLWLRNVELLDGFLQPNPGGPYANRKLFPSLRYLRLEDVTTKANSDPLMTYLVHQTSGGQAISFLVSNFRPQLSREAAEKIRGLVREFIPNVRDRVYWDWEENKWQYPCTSSP